MEESASHLEQWVRNALAHLYDDAYLQNSPLLAYLARDRRQDAVTRGQALLLLLTKAIKCTERGQVRIDAPADEKGLAVQTRCVAHAALPARPAPAAISPSLSPRPIFWTCCAAS